MSLLVVNTLDHCKGMLAQYEIAPWVAAGPSGSPSWVDVGENQALDFVHKATTKKITPGNRMFPTDKFKTGEEITGKVELSQADIRNLAQAQGRLATDVAITTGAAGTAALPLGEAAAGDNYFAIRITVRGQYMLNSGNPTNPYTSYRITLWRCHVSPNVNLKIDKGDFFVYAYDWEPVEDSTVALTGASLDQSIGLVETDVVSPA